ncbi:hypothetical protein P3T76_000835 [Phytophthora citrophthora]|uniref:TAFII28-like protein domain-containing protein n=1 Tax=Phytophthora citrophthora TaxID=4793 RepID=A0AAD9LTX5_9STRA|nr:hypothetical protein P3T76_000835 [Phytophthora citrophthora]
MDADMDSVSAMELLSTTASIANNQGGHGAREDTSTHVDDVDMTLPSASQDTEDEDESKSLVARHGDVTTDDDPQESTEDEVDSDEEKEELSDSTAMLRMMQGLPEDEARRHEQFRRSHFERGAIKRVR